MLRDYEAARAYPVGVNTCDMNWESIEVLRAALAKGRTCRKCHKDIPTPASELEPNVPYFPQDDGTVECFACHVEQEREASCAGDRKCFDCELDLKEDQFGTMDGRSFCLSCLESECRRKLLLIEIRGAVGGTGK